MKHTTISPLHRLMNTPPRRLISADEIAIKMGQPNGWFENYRARLEAIGFPRPALPADRFGADRWDERAIDLWLDGRMDPELLKTASQPRRASIDAAGWEHKLNQRSKEITL